MKVDLPYLIINEVEKRKIFYDKNNYMKVKYKNKGQSVHRLIYSHFNGVIPEGMTINHIDGNKHNNEISNLELMTFSENAKHSWENNLSRPCKGESHGRSILDDVKVLTILTMPRNPQNGIGEGWKNSSLSEVFKVSTTRISAIRNGHEWKHVYDSIRN